MGSLISECWRSQERKLPYGDLVAWPDGRVTILNCYAAQNFRTMERKLFCRPLCDSTIESLVRYDAAGWVAVMALTSIGCPNGMIYGGGGAFGSVGFAARVDNNDDLIWAVVFTGTNPIKELGIHGNTLIALNERSDLRLEINLDTLIDIRMIADNDRGIYF